MNWRRHEYKNARWGESGKKRKRWSLYHFFSPLFRMRTHTPMIWSLLHSPNFTSRSNPLNQEINHHSNYRKKRNRDKKWHWIRNRNPISPWMNGIPRNRKMKRWSYHPNRDNNPKKDLCRPEKTLSSHSPIRRIKTEKMMAGRNFLRIISRSEKFPKNEKNKRIYFARFFYCKSRKFYYNIRKTMAQAAIREHDAKNLFSEYTGVPYFWVLIENGENMEQFCNTPLGKKYDRYVIKPDHLFGKRGKYGLVWVNLSNEQLSEWWKEHDHKTVTIGHQTGKLTTFLIEPFIPHHEEYYVAIKTERDHDILYFSRVGGINIEENWETVSEKQIPLFSPEHGNHESQKKHISHLIESLTPEKRVQDFLKILYAFFVERGLTYLEVNPFTFDEKNQGICLDMVAKIDTTEGYRKKEFWKNITLTHPFWSEKSEAEKYIEKLDNETGASLKFRILNPEGHIWLLTSGGGASVIIADTLADLWYAHEIGNYGEASGNPDRENTRAYADTLIRTMLANRKHGQYIIIAGAIANFTHIDKTFAGIIDALKEHQLELIKYHIRLLVRRGGINDTIWLRMIQESAEEMGIPCDIASWDEYMTDILKKIELPVFGQ